MMNTMEQLKAAAEGIIKNHLALPFPFCRCGDWGPLGRSWGHHWGQKWPESTDLFRSSAGTKIRLSRLLHCFSPIWHCFAFQVCTMKKNYSSYIELNCFIPFAMVYPIKRTTQQNKIMWNVLLLEFAPSCCPPECAPATLNRPSFLAIAPSL